MAWKEEDEISVSPTPEPDPVLEVKEETNPNFRNTLKVPDWKQ